MEKLLDEKLAEIQTENTDEELKLDEKYTDFEQKIRDILHPGDIYIYIYIYTHTHTHDACCVCFKETSWSVLDYL